MNARISVVRGLFMIMLDATVGRPVAKAAVARFLDAIRYDTVDAGALGPGGRRFQFGTSAFLTPTEG